LLGCMYLATPCGRMMPDDAGQHVLT
jgi:hypothetical protein